MFASVTLRHYYTKYIHNPKAVEEKRENIYKSVLINTKHTVPRFMTQSYASGTGAHTVTNVP